ncbi:Ubiquitin-associated domain-containing protein [Cinnamomum micranthum f. kanehirae]|uniref:Elongation factor Ts, mitochondrial n=1 Tax=Cinnamomum micranthum f. kanehirae TaxID=337451 RepID=A0A443NH91_9MAGN|nr:Ubiquitin-associated domain-containing protein [Cinnamomum micranthum f. kanehirae]
MMPVIPCSIGNISLFPRTTAFTSRKENRQTRCKIFGKSTIPSFISQRFPLPRLTSVKLFTKYKRGSIIYHRERNQILASIGTDVEVEEPVVEGEDIDRTSEVPLASTETSESSLKGDEGATPAQSKRTRPVRKSEMPPVKNEDLILGATFTGKVRSVQPFGAFVDFGAFTDGLVHVSQLTDSFVKDIGSFVSIGQEVKVRLLEVNFETGRISLTMREGDDINKLQQRKDTPAVGGREPRSARKNKSNQRRDDVQKSSKFVQDQILDGTVKNLTRAGAFISLPEGEEGFLPSSEQSEGHGTILGTSLLQVGQDVNVRVLRITRGQVTLTMKKEDNVDDLNLKLNKGVWHSATNPFEVAFRKNEAIATFLEERERMQKSTEISVSSTSPEHIEGPVVPTETKSNTPVVLPSSSEKDPVSVYETTQEDELSPKTLTLANAGTVTDIVEDESNKTNTTSEARNGLSSSETIVADEVVASVDETTQEDELSPKTLTLANAGTVTDIVEDKSNKTNTTSEARNGLSSSETIVTDEVVVSVNDTSKNDNKVETEVPPLVESEVSSIASIVEQNEAPMIDEVEEDSHKTSSPGETAGQISSSASEVVKEVVVSEANDNLTKDQVEIEVPPVVENEASSDAANVINEALGPDEVKEDQQKTDSPGESADQFSSLKSEVVEEIVVSEANDSLIKDKVEIKAPLAMDQMASAVSHEDTKEATSTPEQTGSVSSSDQTETPQGSTTKVAAVSPALVKQLREETGAGMMDCKKALAETGGDIVKAQEFLRKKGLASAEKKASRVTAEGRIGSYVHDNRIGVLIEVNCETDFVSRGDIFKQLVDDLAMQVAACPQVQYLVSEDVPEEIVSKEREIEMQKEDLLKKPEQMRSKIVEGRIRKRLEEFALLEQPYIKNDKMVVKDWVKQTIATIGENIKVRRFLRYNLGEGLEKKSQDFAAEVAAQTAAKSPAGVSKDQSAGVANETIEKPPAVAISAALVKQLREETGAGMMDCKKALTETERKGLSAADKKSSRLAAEGRIASYIHDSRIGVLIEVNCETDFVGRSEKFKELVDDLAMQVVACPQVQFVSMDEIPASILSKERELEMQREDLQSKPENIREKIVEGRVSKRLGELALLEQPFIKDDSVLVKDLVKQTVAAIGENIKVRRFVRFTLGEVIEGEKLASEA